MSAQYECKSQREFTLLKANELKNTHAYKMVELEYEHKCRMSELEAQRDHLWLVESSKKTMEFAQNSLKTTMLINGAAIISILTYLGNSKKYQNFESGLFCPISGFILGVLLAALATITAYRTQDHYTHNKFQKAKSWHIMTVCLGVASIIIFLISSFTTAAILTNLSISGII